FLLAPRAHHVPAAARAAAVRMVDGVHDLAANFGTPALPARLARLAPGLELVLLVADDADRRQTPSMYQPHLRRRHAHCHVLAFLGHDLRRHARRTAELSALPDLELDVVHGGAERYFRERQRVARTNV